MNEYAPTGFSPDDHRACAVCHRNRCSPKGCRCHDRACPGCKATLDEQLEYLAVANKRMPLALVRGAGGGEKVRTSKTAPLPLNLGPLSLTAAGRTDDEVRDAFVPKTDTWTTIERITVTEYAADGTPAIREQDVELIHRGPVLDEHGRRVLIPAGDQHGPLPLDVWARGWALDWRTEFGHSIPGEPQRRLVRPKPAPGPRVGPGWLRSPVARSALDAYLAAIRRAATRTLAADVLGIGPAVTSAQRDVLGEDHDPLAREWGHRYGDPASNPRLAADVGYLRTWLGHACEHHPDVAGFAEALRALVTAVKHTLGDRDDREYLGRCPTGYRLPDGTRAGRELHDRETGDPTVCGAALWQDPAASVIACPRCHQEFSEREYLRLAGWIWLAWPIDRRRRYTLDQCNDIQQATLGGKTDLRLPVCEHGRPVAVTWRDATEPGDYDKVNGRRVPRRMRRIADVDCATGGALHTEQAAS
jgi:hypothetical protein